MSEHEGPLPHRLELGDLRIWLAEPAMMNMFDLLARMAAGSLPILVHGETGVGKEIAVRAIHDFSPRRHRPLVSINCAAIPEGLAESELFGHEKGAFSGADAAKPGLFETAADGTVFLDEVGELPLASQARLLRALDTQRITRVGGVVERPVDVRVVAATNRDLEAEISTGRFRKDLYYRLSGAVITVPPLRDRPRDLPHIARELLAIARARLGRGEARLSELAMHRLIEHGWPGNVRELKNAMEYAASVASADEIDVRHLPPSLRRSLPDPPPAPSDIPHPVPQFRPLAEEIRALEELRMRQALASTNNVQTAAAALLQMPRRTFVAKMKLYNLTPTTETPKPARRRRRPTK